MTRKLATALVTLLALCVFAMDRGLTQEAQQQGEQRHVVIISIDGLVPEYYLAPARAGLKVPNLSHMKLDGAFAEGMEGVYPSVTYPSHTTMVTGVLPAKHGIIDNKVFEEPTVPQTGSWYWFAEAIKTETLWTAAKKAGLVTAAVGWPVTVGAAIDFNMPEIWDPMESPVTFKRGMEHTTPGLLDAAKAAGVSLDGSTDTRRTAVSEYVIATHKPHLALIHLIELDRAHHDHGVRSPEAISATEKLDGFIGRIVDATRRAGIFEKTTFLIVSDHGFADVRKRFEPRVVLVKEKMISLDQSGKPVDWKATAWPAGGSCAIILRDPKDGETAARVVEIFDRIAAKGDGPLYRILKRPDLDKLGAAPSALLVLDAAPGFEFGSRYTGSEISDVSGLRGAHGHLPSRADMRAALIVFGQAARVGARVPLARMIDIAPTVAALMGLELPDAQGRPLDGLVWVKRKIETR